jgi:hypothetical protein
MIRIGLQAGIVGNHFLEEILELRHHFTIAEIVRKRACPLRENVEEVVHRPKTSVLEEQMKRGLLERLDLLSLPVRESSSRWN